VRHIALALEKVIIYRIYDPSRALHDIHGEQTKQIYLLTLFFLNQKWAISDEKKILGNYENTNFS